MRKKLPRFGKKLKKNTDVSYKIQASSNFPKTTNKNPQPHLTLSNEGVSLAEQTCHQSGSRLITMKKSHQSASGSGVLSLDFAVCKNSEQNSSRLGFCAWRLLLLMKVWKALELRKLRSPGGWCQLILEDPTYVCLCHNEFHTFVISISMVDEEVLRTSSSLQSLHSFICTQGYFAWMWLILLGFHDGGILQWNARWMRSWNPFTTLTLGVLVA